MIRSHDSIHSSRLCGRRVGGGAGTACRYPKYLCTYPNRFWRLMRWRLIRSTFSPRWSSRLALPPNLTGSCLIRVPPRRGLPVSIARTVYVPTAVASTVLGTTAQTPRPRSTSIHFQPSRISTVMLLPAGPSRTSSQPPTDLLNGTPPFSPSTKAPGASSPPTVSSA